VSLSEVFLNIVFDNGDDDDDDDDEGEGEEEEEEEEALCGYDPVETNPIDSLAWFPPPMVCVAGTG